MDFNCTITVITLALRRIVTALLLDDRLKGDFKSLLLGLPLCLHISSMVWFNMIYFANWKPQLTVSLCLYWSPRGFDLKSLMSVTGVYSDMTDVIREKREGDLFRK